MDVRTQFVSSSTVFRTVAKLISKEIMRSAANFVRTILKAVYSALRVMLLMLYAINVTRDLTFKQENANLVQLLTVKRAQILDSER